MHRIKLLTLVAISTLLISSCADFKDQPEETQPTPVNSSPANPNPEQPPQPSSPTPPVSTPTPSPSPQLPPPSDTEKEMCEAERRWALQSRLIDLNQFYLYQNRNFAPVFNTPGVRQSGVEGWYRCALALRMNGFISDNHF